MRGTVVDGVFTNKLQIEVVGEWLDITVTVSSVEIEDLNMDHLEGK
jgi:hypothetical protein